MDSLIRDISELSAGLAEGLERLQYGSFADRNPALGKMEKCIFCKKRRRQFSLVRCCNPNHVKVIDRQVPKSLIKKLMHKRHGQNRNFRIREITKLFQKDANLLFDAAKEMHVKTSDLAAIPAFAEKYILWSREKQDRKLRNMQKESRRINRNV